MNVLEKIASALNRRDEVPNQELAEAIVLKKDRAAVKDLILALEHKSTAIQNDCIKVLYEIGERNEKMILPYLDTFIAVLKHKNNRLQWGSMHALDVLTPHAPAKIYAYLPQIMEAADLGSVITRDHAVGILIKLLQVDEYAKDAFDLYQEQLVKSPENQFPMYAERAAPFIPASSFEKFEHVLRGRLQGLSSQSRINRVKKILNRLKRKL